MKRKKQTTAPVGSICDEFGGAQLGDTRLGPRLVKIVERVAVAPGESFPTLFADPSELEGLYRFTGNERIDAKAIWEPHLQRTLARCAAQAVVRVLHDTTDFIFSGEREGLGVVMQRTKGFFLHAALAVAGDEERTPLGVVGLVPYVRTRQRGMKTLNAWKEEARKRPREEKESARWEKLALDVDVRMSQGTYVIHVMDQEADDFALLAALAAEGLHYVVRVSSKRQVAGNNSGPLQQWLEQLPGDDFREVEISRRTSKQSSGKHTKTHPVREERLATLKVRFGEARLPRPQHAQAGVQALSVSVVQVFEPHPPEGEKPIQWTLFTSELVTTAEEAAAVVDHYRARWVIEEFFKSLKTGCALEERQLTTFASLVRTLAIFAPIAWHLLLVRTWGRKEKSPPATTLFLPRQLLILAALYEERCNKTLPKSPSVKDAMLAIAKLGGHLPRNGPPGWLTLGRGMRKFRDACRIADLLEGLKL
jgi:hypothetical protein